jgi:hypothetical protein
MTKHRMLFALCIALCAAVLGGGYIQKNATFHLIVQWGSEYDVSSKYADDVAARKTAGQLKWVSPQWSAFYLGHMAVSDAIVMPEGAARTEYLEEALQHIEQHTYPGHAISDVNFLKAGLSAMLGDKSKTDAYAKAACATLLYPVPGVACLPEQHGFAIEAAEDSRLHAIEMYEGVKAMELVGGLDDDELRFGEAVALLYFDPPAARQRRDQLQDAHAFTPRRLDIYCHTAHYVDSTDAADKALCTQPAAR